MTDHAKTAAHYVRVLAEAKAEAAKCPLCGRIGGCSHDPKYRAYLALVEASRREDWTL